MTTEARKPNILILIAGLVTSFICLFIVYLLNKVEVNLMGLYVIFIIPAGGILVGLGSGSGYALSSRLFNVHIKKSYLYVIILLALATYTASHYVTYLSALQAEGLTGNEVSFIDYIRFTAENTTYSFRGTSGNGVELGKGGYIFMGVEALGFALGTFLPLLILSQSAFCPNCQLYMKKSLTAYFTTASTLEGLKSTPRKERAAYLTQAVADANAKYQELAPVLESKGVVDIRPFLEPNAAKPGRMLAYVQVILYECPTGDSAVVKPSVAYQGLDNKAHTESKPEIKKGQPSIAVPV